MASHGDESRSAAARGTSSHHRIQVEDDKGLRPFMRGIMVHSLVARGVSFEDAYRVANQVRDHLRGQVIVRRDALGELLRELVGAEVFRDERPWLPPDIGVIGSGGVRPFSKGRLSQSLLAAALDPNDAFDVAREIERELVARGTREIDRGDLRKLAFETLARDQGRAAAKRYLVWRRVQDQGRPVIILLGGTTGAGKTSLALEVAHRLGIGRVLSTDSIRQIMRITLAPELVPAIHGSSYEAHRLMASASLGEQPVIEGFRAQAEIVSVGTKASIDRALSENASVVIDGCSVVPGLIDLDAYREGAEVVFLLVAVFEPQGFESRFAERAIGERARAQHRYLENMEGIVAIQDYLLELADRYDVPIVDNASFDRSVLLIIRHVTETLAKRGDIDAAHLD